MSHNPLKVLVPGCNTPWKVVLYMMSHGMCCALHALHKTAPHNKGIHVPLEAMIIMHWATTASSGDSRKSKEHNRRGNNPFFLPLNLHDFCSSTLDLLVV